MTNKIEGMGKFVVISLRVIFSIFIIMFICISLFIGSKSDDLDIIKKDSKLVFIRENIVVNVSDGREIMVDLPKKFDDDFTYSYNFVAKSVDENKKLFMYIKGSYQKFTLSYEDKVIYERNNVENRFVESGGDYIRVVMIPDEYIGKQLTISFESLKQSNYGILVPYIILGTHSDIILYSYEEDLDVFVIAIFLIVFSFESFIIQFALVLYKKSYMSSFLGSLYALVLGMYIIIRTPALYFFVSRGSFVYVLDYLLFLILPLTIALFMIGVAKKKYGKKKVQKIIEILLSVFVINVIVQILLTFFGYIEFMEVQSISQLAVVSVALLTIVIPFTIEDFEFKRILSIAMAILMITLIALLGVYLKTYKIRYMTILGTVGGIFILFQYLVIMKMYSNTYAISYRAKLNKGLAFTDNLTRILNRNAFENDIRNVDKRGQKMLLMIIDINNLKEINDKFGHNKGDFIIKSVADMLNKMRINFAKTTSYRIGGDEFVVTAFDVDNDYGKKLETYLNSQVVKFRNRENDVFLNFGMAYGITNVDDGFNVDEFMQKVDKEMYEDKKLKKRNFSM